MDEYSCPESNDEPECPVTHSIQFSDPPPEKGVGNLLCRLKLAGPVGAGLVLWAVSLQRGPGAALALSAGQWRPHDRGAATPARRGSRAQADPALGGCTLSPGPGRPGGRPHVGHRTHAAAGLQP